MKRKLLRDLANAGGPQSVGHVSNVTGQASKAVTLIAMTYIRAVRLITDVTGQANAKLHPAIPVADILLSRNTIPPCRPA